MVRSLPPAAVVAWLVACSGSPVVQPLDFGFDPIDGGARYTGLIFGTSADDLWVLGAYGKDGQADPWDAYLRYWDGSSVRDVPMGDRFREGACGMPSAAVGVAKGELWLGSIHVPQCGMNPPIANDRLIFGRLRVDGSWEDHSTDFPLAPAGTYKAIDLLGRDGVVYAVVTYDTAGPSTFKLFRYGPDGARTELPMPPRDPWVAPNLRLLEVDEFFSIGTPNYRFAQGAWEPLDAMAALSGRYYVAGKGDRWFHGNVEGAVQPVVFRYDGSAFTRRELKLAEGKPPGLEGTIPFGLVPRGDGRFTWVIGSVRSEGPRMGVWAHDFDGQVLGPRRSLAEPQPCIDGQTRCLEQVIDHAIQLQDGNLLIVTSQWQTVVRLTGL